MLRIMDGNKLLKTQAYIPSTTNYCLHILGHPHSAGKLLAPFQETGIKEMWYPWQNLHSINRSGSLASQMSGDNVLMSKALNLQTTIDVSNFMYSRIPIDLICE